MTARSPQKAPADGFPTTRESGQEGLVSMSVQEYVELKFAVVKAQRKGDRLLVKIEKKTIEKRLEALNGEASRLKTVLDASVPQQVFNQYVTTQRDKDDEKERSTRERLEAYQKATADAFQAYANENTRRMQQINIRIATFAGGGLALFTAIQFWFNYVK